MNDSRNPSDLLHETDYWRAILEDIDAMNEGILALAATVASMPVLVLELLLSHDPTGASEQHNQAISRGLDQITALQGSVQNVLALAKGRVTVLRAQGGLEP